MYCKWCGMDSENETKCTWCGKPLKPPAPETGIEELEETIVKPGSAEQPHETPPSAPPEADEEAEEPAPAPDDIEVGEDVEFEPTLPSKPPKEEKEPEPFELRLRKYLSIMLVLQAGAMVIVHFYPDSWLGQFLPLLFIAGLLIGILRVIPDFEESLLPDIYTVGAITVLLGPLYATLIYWLLGSTRRSLSTSVLWLMATYVVLRVMVGAAVHGPLDTALYILVPNLSLSPMSHVAELFPLLVTGGGWALSRFAREFMDELSWE